MKILVTGGAGFIGSAFVRKYAYDHELIIVDKLTYAGDLRRIEEVRDRIKFYKADVADKTAIEEIFDKEKPEAVVHFAAESHVDRSIQDPTPFIETNVKGTQVMLDASRKYGIEKFVHISTDEVYGELGKEGQFTEESPLRPNSPYSVSKAAADMLARAYHRTYGLPVIVARPCNNYGPWQYPEKLIPVVIKKALNNEPIPVYGQGLNVREWLYVDDCIEAVYLLLQKGKPGEAYNIGSGEEKGNIEVVKEILRILGKPESLITFVEDRPGHDFRYSLNSKKIKMNYAWKHKVNFNEGIRFVIDWYKKHF
ncbi:dTDP-glucose 4,6-dehydratase [Carboxydothermus hydrogenoformans]|uniref:dTDP-glucose 4,6-dehydratase n=1 Tax=Carboxydothermus hydrogenoformans (strain ATCC BAA-161 / DSM 6008 / Z-2901) TaxID=246194 RepID=Q3ADF8_CARHZ|nr:dTDP-glucose 4,6-dehydratase [Carboxydothermus hydrogenoformans]ABB14785.1 dTDP-glucose 4,6-dehydratase [Carboxydothermus hydrogenoformans Z-2901]